ncbi:hypothetical protein GGR77_001555 [Xanthomonas translucens]
MTDDLYLLGHGLDAIVQRSLPALPPVGSPAFEALMAAHMLEQPAISAAARLLRYEEARAAVYDRHLALRIDIGRNLQRAWARGNRPPLQETSRVINLIDWKLRRC